MQSAGDMLTESGYSNMMALMGGFRGPREVWFKGSYKEYLFKFHTLLGLYLFLQLTVLIMLTFVLKSDAGLSTMLFFAIPLTTGLFSAFNLSYMEFNRSRFIKLLKMNQAASHDEIYGDDLDSEIKLWAKRAFTLQNVMYFVVSAPILPWGLVPIINEFAGSPWGPRKVSFITWFPYDYQQTPYWIATMLSQTTAGFYSTLINIMFNAVFLCLSLRQLALLVHLKKTFPKIFGVIHTDSNGHVWYTDYDKRPVKKEAIDAEITRRLKIWIKNHQTALTLLAELQSLYSIPLFVQICYAGTVLATGSAAILMGDLTYLELYFIAVFLLGLTFTFFILCRVGDHIKIETHDIVDDLCGQNYFLLSKKQHALIKNVLTARQKPVEITLVGAIPLTTGSFKSVIGTTYSFFTLFTKMQQSD